MSTEPELAVPPRVDTARCSVGTASRRDDRAADRQPAHGVPRPLTWPRRYRSSALGDDSLQRHQQSLDAAGSDASLHVRGGDRFEAPALAGMFVEDLLQVATGHLAADQLLPELQDLVLVPFCHQPMMALAYAGPTNGLNQASEELWLWCRCDGQPPRRSRAGAARCV